MGLMEATAAAGRCRIEEAVLKFALAGATTIHDGHRSFKRVSNSKARVAITGCSHAKVGSHLI